MKEMLQYLKPYWKGLIAATAAVAVSTLCDLLLPTIMSEILNNGVYRADFSYIVRCCAVMGAVALLGLGTVILGAKISNDIVASFCADVRSAVFRKVNQMSFEEFGALGTAALVTRCSHDVETVSWIAAELSGTVVTIPVLFFGGVVLSLRKDAALSLTMLAFVPVILAIVLYIGKRIDGIWEISDRY
ncbi:MAG: ABC transporter transmembrane domain-containing protein, partial [Faecousia sp.]